jgi:hypothetical protein
MPRTLRRGQQAGQEHPAAKLTETQAKEILARLEAGELQKDLADEYGVTPSCICHLAAGTSWPHLGGVKQEVKRGSARPSAKLTEEDIPVIIRRVERGESLTAVARSYSVGRTTIADIWYGRRWTHVPRPTSRRRAVYEDLYG